MSKHRDASGKAASQSEQYDAKHGGATYKGKHRNEDRSRATEITRSTELTSGQFDPNAPR